MLIHPRQRERLIILEILCEKRFINGAASGETQETKVLPKIEQGIRQRPRVLVEDSIRGGNTIRDSITLQKRITR